LQDDSKSSSKSDLENSPAEESDEIAEKNINRLSQNNDKTDQENGSINFDELKEKWRSIISEIAETRTNLGSALRKSHLTGLNGNYLELSFDNGDQYEKGAVEHNSKYIRAFLKDRIGIDIMLKTVTGDFNSVINDSSEEIKKSKKEPMSEEELLKHPTVEKIMENFNGKLAL